ncbi:glutathione-disulfide reductase [Aetokthonos hydrillicola Thurmond2011]|jgi:glutathione reductase (NADPH)|uniref:Glutathione-disulfide reductase n=1 Tax=Aetokthonos hydrillicola Thurmond2011 TaxID=2712845 RepID=A0AAP5M5E7_9CYAN|nr:glutathione-disulfide reductase [Aetokthonos hydrillicola]MBO3461385.1 glutathione-disulfide reductase [Aetokthonos hydrillicola CCALA 1050]MBW4586821.1 glutathione-disulfide reductase [Aetokthonos hydrillicola CCALA 1050]MDR9895821.1 glutathione-disulfide reductase [Aetokthonos hydrillicola Thurmond2011]
MTFDYDLFVIGAGPGGLAAAKKAASYGARVAIAEKEALGGTCVNRGCVPKKLIVHAADVALQNQMAYSYGWSDSQTTFDWTKFIKSVHQHIESIHRSSDEQLQKAGIELIRGQATFSDPHTIKVNENKVTADKILIAVGAQPIQPKIPGIEYSITSREMFHLPYLPKRLAIIGGGYVGVEFSSMMKAFGCQVTIIEQDEMVLSGFDEDLRRGVQEGLTKRSIRFIGNSNAKQIKYAEESFLLTLAGSSQQIVTADTILVATGRAPNTKDLGLENAGVELGEKGAIKVDEYNCTTQENIFAVGDCTNRLPLTPVARSEGVAFANRVFGKKPQKLNYDYVPSAVFARPEAASVGLTEAKAREKFGDSVKCYRDRFQPLFSQLTKDGEQATIKLVVEGESERVLGAHMVGEHAADIIQTLTVAIRKGITKQDLDQTIGIHPTTAEEFYLIDCQ